MVVPNDPSPIARLEKKELIYFLIPLIKCLQDIVLDLIVQPTKQIIANAIKKFKDLSYDSWLCNDYCT